MCYTGQALNGNARSMPVALARVGRHLSVEPGGGKCFDASQGRSLRFIGNMSKLRLCRLRKPGMKDCKMTNANLQSSSGHAFRDESDSIDDAVAGRHTPRSANFITAAESRLIELAEDGKTELARRFDGLVMMAHEFAAKLDSSNAGPFGDYLRYAAGSLESFQATLRDRPVAHLLDDGRDLVRRSPQVAIGVALVAGFIAARLIKSGSNR
jgi:hypothetical protein